MFSKLLLGAAAFEDDDVVGAWEKIRPREGSVVEALEVKQGGSVEKFDIVPPF